MNPICRWKYDHVDECWNAGCGESLVFTVDGPEENGYTFCPFCGKSITEDWEEKEEDQGE